jgi:hypothetical protein
MYIAILLHQKNYSQKAKDVMQFIVSKQPNSGSIQYLNRRLKRNSNLLFNKNIPAFIPNNLVDIELLLASNQVVITNSKPLIIKHFFIILDFVKAMINKKLILVLKGGGYKVYLTLNFQFFLSFVLKKYTFALI